MLTVRLLRIQFTGKIPLFDFFDSGPGKEQADTKIRGKTPGCSLYITH